MNPKISVIVPMYNVERYLDRCVKSLLKQTLTNIEIILIKCSVWRQKHLKCLQVLG